MPEKNKEIIFEFVRQGNSIRASAFDVELMNEAVIIVPPHTPKSYIKLLLLRKLTRTGK